jgi:multicomponent Na+:H+ antiporter subunit C
VARLADVNARRRRTALRDRLLSDLLNGASSSTVDVTIGLVLISQAANLLIFTASGLERGSPPLVPAGESNPPIPFADPLPQALILTAIVISFGVLAFTLVLVKRAYQTVGTDDLDEMRSTDT